MSEFLAKVQNSVPETDLACLNLLRLDTSMGYAAPRMRSNSSHLRIKLSVRFLNSSLNPNLSPWHRSMDVLPAPTDVGDVLRATKMPESPAKSSPFDGLQVNQMGAPVNGLHTYMALA